MAWLPDADQSGLPVPRLHPRGTDRPGLGSFPGSGAACRYEGYTGVAELLFQVTYDGSGPLSRARPLYSIHEAEEYVALDDGRGAHHPPRAGVLRLAKLQLLQPNK